MITEACRAWLDSSGSRFNGSGRQRGKSLFHLACIDWTLRENVRAHLEKLRQDGQAVDEHGFWSLQESPPT